MNVWYITMVFPVPSETFVATEVDALRRNGIRVSVHSLMPPRWAKPAILAERGLEDLTVSHGTMRNQAAGVLYCLLRPRLLWSLLRMIVPRCLTSVRHALFSLALIPRVVQLFVEVERTRPDVVHLFWGHYPSLLGYLLLDFLPDVVLSTSLSAYDLGLEFGGSGPVACRAGMVRTWAAANVPEIESLGVPRDRIDVIYQGLDVDGLADRGTASTIQRRIVTAGRLVANKGMEDVLATFRCVHRRWPDATLVVLGKGPERERLTQLASEWGLSKSVRFAGHVPYETVFHEMAQAEVFLFLSYYDNERLPNVVKEAMAARCLCVVSDTVGIEEVLEDGQHGHVVPRREIDTAARRVGEAFSDDAARHRLAEAAGDHVRNVFDNRVVIPQLLSRWESLLREKRAGTRLGEQL